MHNLVEQLDSADFVALNLCRTRDGWQVSLEKSKGSFSIRVGVTPSEAIAAVLGVEAPEPISRATVAEALGVVEVVPGTSLPPCPVPLPV